jgi:hypothetical protein
VPTPIIEDIERGVAAWPPDDFLSQEMFHHVADEHVDRHDAMRPGDRRRSQRPRIRRNSSPVADRVKLTAVIEPPDPVGRV